MEYVVIHEGQAIVIEMEPFRDDIISQLVSSRKEQKMTQQDIADATGMQRANVARFEGKKMMPTIDVLMRYAAALGYDLDISLKKRDVDL